MPRPLNRIIVEWLDEEHDALEAKVVLRGHEMTDAERAAAQQRMEEIAEKILEIDGTKPFRA